MRDRLRKLEDRSEAKGCPECKLQPEGPGFKVIQEDEEPEQKWCPTCGRDLYFFIRVVYESS